jgi:hypothetical protein
MIINNKEVSHRHRLNQPSTIPMTNEILIVNNNEPTAVDNHNIQAIRMKDLILMVDFYFNLFQSNHYYHFSLGSALQQPSKYGSNQKVNITFPVDSTHVKLNRF